ncbi:unnamed protein product [Heligmosomoides polygyrus]|uniref:Pilus assembly protein n=1 Tax=Heligmosomoides polygyrus TaxID=6339 RepID=A0A183FMS0_HELPZ|nr:unnamed protein product [Heligmosomoides polygyrus]
MSSPKAEELHRFKPKPTFRDRPGREVRKTRRTERDLPARQTKPSSGVWLNEINPAKQSREGRAGSLPGIR